MSSLRSESEGTQAAWTELGLQVRPEAVEAIADLLQELTGRGVSMEPPIEALGPDEGYTLDEAAPFRLLAYFPGAVPAAQRAAVRRALQRAGFAAPLAGRLHWSTVREEDWAERWKEHYNIERAGRLVIRPAWREYTPAPGEVVITLDPGMAFGTGQHPTTRMCLLGMQEEQGTGSQGQGLRRVLDLGCGSGILAIAAVALGAEHVLAVDTEEQAVKATRGNVALNGMEDRITVHEGSIEAASGDGRFELILANINAAAITALAAEMASAMQPGGRLYAGGVIAEREAGVAAALLAAGLAIERVMAEGDWRTFVARRPAT